MRIIELPNKYSFPLIYTYCAKPVLGHKLMINSRIKKCDKE